MPPTPRKGSLRGSVSFRVERIQPPGEVGTGAVEQRPVMALDHHDARAHDPRERVDAHAGGERVGSERAPQVVDTSWCRYASGLDRRS